MAGDRALIILTHSETSQGCPEPRPFPSTECGAWLESCSRSVLARSYGRVGWAFGLERRLEHDGEGLKSASSGAWPGRAPKVTKSVGCRWRLELPGARHPELLRPRNARTGSTHGGKFLPLLAHGWIIGLSKNIDSLGCASLRFSGSLTHALSIGGVRRSLAVGLRWAAIAAHGCRLHTDTDCRTDFKPRTGSTHKAKFFPCSCTAGRSAFRPVHSSPTLTRLPFCSTVTVGLVTRPHDSWRLGCAPSGNLTHCEYGLDAIAVVGCIQTL